MWLNVRSNAGYALMLVYIIGNALTFNHLMKTGRASIAQTGDATLLTIKSLFISTVWPVYWASQALAGWV